MDLSTKYLGFDLPHPVICGASPFADSLDSARRIEDAGAAAIVIRSLFEEQITSEAMTTHESTETHRDSFGEALSFFPNPDEFVLGPDRYLDCVRRTKEALRIPVFASLNGTTLGTWLDYAARIEQAGADGLELNIASVPTDPRETGEMIETRTREMVEAVTKAISIPVAVKVTPFYTSFANFAAQLDDAGASGIVLFNRSYEPDLDPEQLEFVSKLRLSDPTELLLRLRWVAVLSGHVRASLAVTGGVHEAVDIVKAVMCGAHAVEVVAAVVRRGVEHITSLRRELTQWLETHEYESLSQMQGSMNLWRCPDPAALARGNYIQLLQTSVAGLVHLR